MPVNEFATYVNRGTKPSEVFYGNGQGIVTEGESEVAIFTGEGFGIVHPSGNIKWRASIFYQTTSTSKWAFLNNLVGISENQLDPAGNAVDKQWEWKYASSPPITSTPAQ